MSKIQNRSPVSKIKNRSLIAKMQNRPLASNPKSAISGQSQRSVTSVQNPKSATSVPYLKQATCVRSSNLATSVQNPKSARSVKIRNRPLETLQNHDIFLSFFSFFSALTCPKFIKNTIFLCKSLISNKKIIQRLIKCKRGTQKSESKERITGLTEWQNSVTQCNKVTGFHL